MPKSTFLPRGAPLKPLRALCQVIRLGSVSRAAEALSLSQPAVTLQLQALEREYGVRLLERNGRRLLPTRQGEVLYALAKPLIDGFDGLDRTFREQLRGLDAGNLDIAAGNSVTRYLLPGLVEAFRGRHPEVRLRLHTVAGLGAVELLRSEVVDFAIVTMRETPADLDFTALRAFEPMLILPLGHPLATKSGLTLQDLSPYGVVLPPQRQVPRLVESIFQHNRVPYTVALEVDGAEAIKQYVAMGLGISIVSGLCLAEADHVRLVACSLSAYFPACSYGVATRKGKPPSPQAQAFIDLLRPATTA